MMVSMVKRCHQTETHPICIDEIWSVIKSGEHDLKQRITQIRNRYEAEKAFTGSTDQAKKAISDLKMELPGFLPSGTFSKRESGALVEYSGILCADLDSLGTDLGNIKTLFKSCRFVRAMAVSPSGDGLKVFFNVINDPSRHEDSFRAIRQFVLDWAGVEIDEKCKDPSRICFFTHDPDLWIRTEGNEIIEPLEPLPRGRTMAVPDNIASLPEREQIAYRLLGELRYDPAKGGYFCRCPGEQFHSAKTADKHTILYLTGAPTLSCQHQSCAAVVEAFNKVLRSEIGKAESRVSHLPYRDVRHETLGGNGAQSVVPALDKPLITFYSPKQLLSYVPPDNIQLIGDYHIIKDTGFVVVIGGPAGVGKSLTSNYLALAGAIGSGEWFGLPVHRQFKTMIIQTENGLFRLSRNFKEMDCDKIEDFVRICEPPPFGLMFRNQDFQKVIANEIAKFAPDVVVLDPFNSVARDQEQRTYLETIDLVRSSLPVNTSLVIVAHTRKPQPNERAVGRSLMNILAGSHVLVTVPRTVFVLQYASDDPEDCEVVWTCCKNNDGELGKRSAWKRQSGLFLPVTNFDWTAFDGDDKDKRVIITAEMVEEIFEDGPLIRSLARDKLLEISGASKAAVYKALSPTGRFCDNLIFKGETINWIRSKT